MRVRAFLTFSAILCAGLAAHAEMTLAPLFSDGVVLQRDKPIPVWGKATPGERLAVTFRGETITATGDASGRWIVYLSPAPASAEPTELVAATADQTVVLRDVVVGEVWLAAGQSNMEWPISHVRDDEKKLAMVELPLIRHIKIARSVAPAPRDVVATDGWRHATPEHVGGFTAVGYFFARELHRKLRVPVGIIHSSWGGTPIEAWMSDRSRALTTLASVIEERWAAAMAEWPPERVARYPVELAAWEKAQEQANATGTKNPLPWPPMPATPDSPLRPGGTFNGMIAPLQPFALRGFLWYQGESNVDRPNEYEELFPAMIRSWRSNWGDDTLPFYFVQIPNYADEDPNGRKWARLREAQTKALELPRTGMAVAIDVGDPGDLHPKTKMPIGVRLAHIAKAEIYDIPSDSSGPVFARASREGEAMRVSFTHATTGLVAHHRPAQALELAGADRVFHPAQGRIERDTIVVTSPLVKEPVAVRYAWTNAPDANLYNGSGLPAEPFRSDDW